MQPFHPAFAVRLRRTGPAGTHGHRRSVDFTTGVAQTESEGRLSRVFVSRADDVIVHQVTTSDLDISLDHRLPGAPHGLGVGHGAVLTPEGALLTLRARYPGSDRAYTGITLVAVSGGRTTLTPPGIRVTGADSVLLLTRVLRHTHEPDALAEARSLGELLPDQDPFDGLLARHTESHRPAYERVTLDLGADPAERALPGSALLRKPDSPALLERLRRPTATTCSPPAASSRPASPACGPATGTRPGRERSPTTPTSTSRPRRRPARPSPKSPRRSPP